ncbi:MAG: tRNA 2-thiocytidine(32) synthetase TtcA [Lachnospiraceae bacterium]|nr:tRNA 2-thiocytidine(32) synthetase TtcA [Lachnospiraceae bacterium]MBR6350546.1 tRNA 2-thiocytidine(32) synthetase TtcA [Lachnospiraceae bacterium]
MQLQQLLSYVRRAVDDYQMIDDGDRIAVGVSGGKDSLALLYALKELRRFYPKKFDIEAISVDLGFGNIDFEQIRSFTDSLGVEYSIAKTDIAEVVFNQRNEKSPCSLCAKMRKGALNTMAKEHGCNKTAFGHHKDDIVNTMLLSLLFEGRFYSFKPVTYLDRMDLTLIRPLMYVEEADIIGFVNKYNLQILKNPCPVDGETKRQYAKELANQLNRDHPGAKERMFRAVLTGVYGK